MKDVVIVANGEFASLNIIQEATKNKTIIALDGASNKLIDLGIQPDFVLGDFDSITSTNDVENEKLIATPDQNKTDLMKAIEYCDDNQATSITLLCTLGNRLDHHESALRALRKYYSQHRPMILHTNTQSVRFAKDETIQMHGNIGDNCAILAYPYGKFSSRGLEFDVQDYPLEFGFSESVSNALKHKEATLEISGEALIIMPPMLKAQRSC